MLGSSEAKAQDFLHDIFLKIIEKPYLFDQSQKFKTWIFQIAYNKCKNEYRKINVRGRPQSKAEINEIYFSRGENPEEKINYKILIELIYEVLAEFNDKHYNTFILRYQHDLSLNEIAEISDCPAGTVKSRLFSVTKKLAEKLKDYKQ